MTNEITTKQKTIWKIDASFLSNSGCRLREFYILQEQLQEPMVAIDIQFGSAFHHFTSEMRKTNGDYGTCIKEAIEILKRPCLIPDKKEHLTDPKLLQLTCFDFWEWIQKDNLELLYIDEVCKYCNGHKEVDIDEEKKPEPCKWCNATGVLRVPFVEKNFSIPVYEDDNLIIMLCGTMDWLSKVKNGCVTINDYKTTSYKDEKAYFYPYKLSVQLRTYMYALQWHIKQYPNNPFWADIAKYPLGCFIYGIFIEPFSSGKQTRFIRSDLIQFDEKDMVEYDMLLKRKITELVGIFNNWTKEQIKPFREGIINGACEKKFSLCQFAPLCMTNNEIYQGHIKKNKFVVKPYDPMLFSK